MLFKIRTIQIPRCKHVHKGRIAQIPRGKHNLERTDNLYQGCVHPDRSGSSALWEFVNLFTTAIFPHQLQVPCPQNAVAVSRGLIGVNQLLAWV